MALPQNAEQALLQLAKDVSAIKQGQDDLRRELLGNGQPGRIQTLEADVKNLSKKHWMISGGLVVLGHTIKQILAKLGLLA